MKPPTCLAWKKKGLCCASASPNGSSIALKFIQPASNLHVFTAGCEEIGCMLMFRDRLRAHEDERLLYERTKRDLAQRTWKHVQDYADAKTAVVREILGRAGD